VRQEATSLRHAINIADPWKRIPLGFRLVVFSMTLPLGLAACLGSAEPLGYDRIRNSDQYISEDQLESIVTRSLTRAEVIELLGPPTLVNDAARSIGYERCLTSSALATYWFFVPVQGKKIDVTDCSRAGLWFDAQDRATAWNELRINSERGSPDKPFDEWLTAPGNERRR
jgi:hypothetical protein